MDERIILQSHSNIYHVNGLGEGRFKNLDDLVNDGLRTMYNEWKENEPAEERGDAIQKEQVHFYI